ncbi:hypothetical protein SH661x_003633 [Planctomicrobium sp. SH661]|uniref:hypothetical protein n=1 Tax=Planctomicrobium sp. SH661 TaxID=3448124 RepID=UPI003F5B2C53
MSANVRDIDVIREFRAKLLHFAEELEASLLSMQLDLQRAAEWVEQDRPHYWTNQVRHAFDQVAATRTAYNTCRLRTVAGHRSACIEEKVAHEKAQRRLQHCQEQVERVRQWSIKIRHDADEFRGRMASIRRLLESDIPQALAHLDRSATILEGYAEISRPQADEPE